MSNWHGNISKMHSLNGNATDAVTLPVFRSNQEKEQLTNSSWLQFVSKYLLFSIVANVTCCLLNVY